MATTEEIKSKLSERFQFLTRDVCYFENGKVRHDVITEFNIQNQTIYNDQVLIIHDPSYRFYLAKKFMKETDEFTSKRFRWVINQSFNRPLKMNLDEILNLMNIKNKIFFLHHLDWFTKKKIKTYL